MKKANLAYNWVEYFTLILMIIGLILAISIKSPNFSYVVIFVCGFLSGRLTFRLKGHNFFPYFLILTGFFVGYLIGSFYGNRKIIAIVFLAANIFSYYLLDKGYVK